MFDRRKDQVADKEGDTNDDHNLPREPWYRITGPAGNRIVNKCIRNQGFACYGYGQGWIQGTMPTEQQGQVSRTLRSNHYSYRCCRRSTTITIRNCGGYFVYRLHTGVLCFHCLNIIIY